MKLEGTLDAFSLTEIFSLLSLTHKTGTLHLRRDGAHGAVHLRGGAVTGARADVSRQELGRRLLGAGLADDEALTSVAEQLADDPSLSLAALLSSAANLQPEVVRALAAEQITDAVFSMMRWADGEFSFHVEESDPDDLGVSVTVDDVVAEGQRRLAGWTDLVASVPAPVTVLCVNSAPPDAPTASREEWSLLALVDGRRTVADLVTLSGQGEYAIVAALAGLVSRGLLVVRTESGDALARRQALLAALEGRTDEAITAELAASGPAGVDVTVAVPEQGRGPDAEVLDAEVPDAEVPDTEVPDTEVPDTGASSAGAGAVPDAAGGHDQPRAVEPAGSEQLIPAQAEVDDLPAPPLWGASPQPRVPALTLASGGHGSTSGAHALQPGYDEHAIAAEASSALARDPAINRSLLLRLIAGVRGL